MIKKPWVEGSLEVLELSIEQYFMGVFSDREIDRNRYLRASLINADNAAELVVKAFIEYSRTEKSSGFYNNLKWIRKKGDLYDQSSFKELEKIIRYYHHQRNAIYHHRYLTILDKSDVLDYISNIISLFKLLFKDEYERSIEQNMKRRLLIAYAEMEKIIIDYCTQNHIEFNRDTTLQDIILEMLGMDLIDNETAQLLQQVLLRQEELIPKAKPLGEIIDLYELEALITDLVERLK